ncbi:MAG: hypothetical protein JNL96_04495 [Planctomycetaceae bacterium]|nr:hypothetical protein [Planctomycetales bacterium]MBL9090457.1 hypothetical protein [Planctomycetaceae bacterium]MBN8627780.1 hypothetical protein [Planctomycetota bacterium]
MKSLFCLLAVVLTAVGCDVDVKDPGKAPEVHVTPGRAPDVDVRGPDVDINSKQKEVTVPDVDIKTEKKTITVPDIDVKIPKENEK